MKKAFLGVQIKVDGVAIASDVKPEIKNLRTMVPLCVISENLGASVEWSNSEVILAKSNMKVLLKLNSSIAEKNGEKMLLDVKSYVKNNRIFVPIRFIAETFECNVNYSNFTVTIDTKPLVIDGVQNSLARFDVYSLIRAFPSELLTGYPEILIHDVSKDEWYLFNDSASQSINQLIDTAAKNGFLTIISNTVV